LWICSRGERLVTNILSYKSYSLNFLNSDVIIGDVTFSFILLQAIQAALKRKESEIDNVERLGTSLTGQFEGHVLETVDRLNQEWAAIDRKVCNIELSASSSDV
jgi:hypothetical protein